MPGSFTIGDLVDDPSLDNQVIAGRGGLGREVLWAHSCELVDPARWLGPHELLMTIGLCIPSSAAAQRDFIARLDNAGLAGVAIGDDGLAPKLTKTMLSEADARNFPMLRTGASTPFAAIGRTVAAANSDPQTRGVLLLAKLYQIAGQRSPESRRSGADLSELFGTTLTIVDDATNCVIIGPGITADLGARAHPLRTHRPSHLLIDADAQLDGFSLVHLTQVLTVDANVILQEALGRIHDGSTALEEALAGKQASIEQVWAQHPPGYRVIVSTASTKPGQVALACALAGITPTILDSESRVTIATPIAHLDHLRSILAHLGQPAGASAEHRNIADITGAVSEADSEALEAKEHNQLWREFEGKNISLLPRSHTEAVAMITAVLGPLAADSNRSLRETLFSFLDHNLRWNVTAEALCLHRQTLIYRLKQVEKLTGRSVKNTRDIAEMWLAQTAWKQLHQDHI